jgi:hypothetical protein
MILTIYKGFANRVTTTKQDPNMAEVAGRHQQNLRLRMAVFEIILWKSNNDPNRYRQMQRMQRID